MVDEVNKDITGWKVGQRIAVGWYGGHCGHCESCRHGDFLICKYAQVPGISYDGGYADYMIAPTEALALIPKQLSSIEAAPLMCAGVTTYNALRNSGARVGKLIVIGAADENIEVPPLLLISGRRSIMGWPSGTSIDSQDTLTFTLTFSIQSGVRSINQVFPLEHAPDAYELMMSGKARFRCVLTTDN